MVSSHNKGGGGGVGWPASVRKKKGDCKEKVKKKQNIGQTESNQGQKTGKKLQGYCRPFTKEKRKRSGKGRPGKNGGWKIEGVITKRR